MNKLSQKNYVINYQKEEELFSAQKVYQSARRIGASKELAQEISEIIQKEFYPGIKTEKIFKKIKELLNKKNPRLGIIFSLKEGMRKLGPSGFPFEKFVAEIFNKQGYETQINLYLPGNCLDYEIDFLAKKDGIIYIGECKFRHLLEEGLVHTGTVLAYRAKMLDLEKGNLFSKKDFKDFEIKNILATNAKFTKSASKYAKCVGLDLLGWKYPQSKGLEKIIDQNDFYPITILPSLNKNLANIFIQENLILARDILEIDLQKFSQKNKIPKNDLDPLIKEAKILFGRDN